MSCERGSGPAEWRTTDLAPVNESRGVMGETRGDTGLECLAFLLRFHGLAVDPAQVAHRFAGVRIGLTEMLRCAKELQLKARTVKASWSRLARLALPGIAECADGTFIILAK